MATQLIPTTTTALAFTSAIQIHTFYSLNVFTCDGVETISSLPNIKIASYYNSGGVLNSVSFGEGEIIVSGDNIPSSNDIWMNSVGELVVDGADSSGYYIDDDGYLIYDYCLASCSDDYFDCDYIDEDYIE